MSVERLIMPAVAISVLLFGGSRVVVSELIKKRAEPYIAQITDIEKRNGIPPGVLFKLLEKESAFSPDIISGAKRSAVGAVGIAQFMPKTIAWLTGKPEAEAVKIACDPRQAIPLAGKYLASLRKSKGITGWEQALAAYNWGIGNVQNAVNAYGPVAYKDHLPKETRDYIAKIKAGVGGQLA